MKNMPKLFDIEIEDKDEIKASKFISNLQAKGFIGRNKIYLQNYINADISIALSHIKNSYKQQVCGPANWSEEKFADIVLLIAKDRKMLIPAVFLTYGTKYDEGKLVRDVAIEKQKYVNNEIQESNNSSDRKISDDEQELLDYIANNGGGN